MDNVLNPNLYKIAKDIANETYKKHSAYKSMFIQKWIQVKPYLENNKEFVCGGDNRKNKVCRPLIRINKDTPITINELLKDYTKKQLLDLSNKKINDMKGRVYWKTLKFIPSK